MEFIFNSRKILESWVEIIIKNQIKVEDLQKHILKIFSPRKKKFSSKILYLKFKYNHKNLKQ